MRRAVVPRANEGEAGLVGSIDVRTVGTLKELSSALRDEEPLYGLAVVGTVSPDAIWTKGGARPGDLLYLTKPLGTGYSAPGTDTPLHSSSPSTQVVVGDRSRPRRRCPDWWSR